MYIGLHRTSRDAIYVGNKNIYEACTCYLRLSRKITELRGLFFLVELAALVHSFSFSLRIGKKKLN